MDLPVVGYKLYSEVISSSSVKALFDIAYKNVESKIMDNGY